VELAGLDFERMKKDETIASVEREIETLNRDAKERPKASFVWELLDRNHTLLAELYAKKRNAAESVKHRDNAIDACKRGLELDHLSGVFRRNLQLHLAHQAEQKMASDPEAALKLLKLALDHSPRFPPDLAETSILHASFAALDARAGDCYERLNNPREAYSHYFDALEHHQKVAEIEPNAPGIPGVLAYDHRRMAELQLYYLYIKGAAFNYLAAKKILDQMRADKKSLRLLDQQTDKLVKDFLPFAQSLPEGIETLDAAAKQPEAVRFVALRVRVAWLIHAGKMDEAAATAERITAEKSANGDAYAQAAVEFARLTAKDKSNADKYATRTIELLQKAKESGYFRGADDVAWLDWETLFTPIRKDDRFQALVKEVRAKEKN
jgi:tetratricopeptide (TPR) repeat protein